MPRPICPDAILRAFFDAWIDEADMSDEDNEKKVKAFADRWGGLGTTAFKRALQRGDEADRLCAIFALGYLAPAGVERLLAPFLDSPVRKERWASAIGLGENRDEQAFTFLQELLVEDIEYHPPRRTHVIIDTNRNERSIYDKEYDWYTIHRVTITNLLGRWGDPRAIPNLRQALRICWEFEQLPHSRGGLPDPFLREVWQHLEDDLAYALGQLKAWDALDELDFPPSRLLLARMYLVFGSLQVNIHNLPIVNIHNLSIMSFTNLINDEPIDSDHIIKVLQKRFSLTESGCEIFLQQFPQYYQERAKAKWNM
jgi:hypothetical protein